MSGETLGSALQRARREIGAIDAHALLKHVTGRDQGYLAAHPEAELRPREASRFAALVARRAAGEPVAYLTGEREFYGRSFGVSPAVLIPRPETELLVDAALERLAPASKARVLDLGTGSGCIAITIASERSRSKITAVDQSIGALALAQANAVKLAVTNVDFIESDWFSEVPRGLRFDLIVSNPPYVATDDPHLREGDLRFEPMQALEAGPDGLDAIRTLISGAGLHLVPGGWLVLEHGYAQAERVRALLSNAGYDAIFSARDLAGIERVSGGRLTVGRADR